MGTCVPGLTASCSNSNHVLFITDNSGCVIERTPFHPSCSYISFQSYVLGSLERRIKFRERLPFLNYLACRGSVDHRQADLGGLAPQTPRAGECRVGVATAR